MILRFYHSNSPSRSLAEASTPLLPTTHTTSIVNRLLPKQRNTQRDWSINQTQELWFQALSPLRASYTTLHRFLGFASCLPFQPGSAHTAQAFWVRICFSYMPGQALTERMAAHLCWPLPVSHPSELVCSSAGRGHSAQWLLSTILVLWDTCLEVNWVSSQQAQGWAGLCI